MGAATLLTFRLISEATANDAAPGLFGPVTSERIRVRLEGGKLLSEQDGY